MSGDTKTSQNESASTRIGKVDMTLPEFNRDSGDESDRAKAIDAVAKVIAPGIAKHAEQAPGWKDNNPKDAFGVLKASITSYLYLPVLFEMSIGMAAGGFKYGAHNFLVVPPRSSVYTDAAMRHIGAYLGGEDFDPEAGPGVTVHHLTAAMDSLHVLRAAQIGGGPAGDGVGGWIDDRPPPFPKGFMAQCNASMVALSKFVPEPVARYLAGGKRGPGKILKA